MSTQSLERSSQTENSSGSPRPGQPNRGFDGPDGQARQECTFVTLTIADQICGIPVLSVRDILGGQAITRIPLAPREIAGGLNLRGRIVTAIDLRQRLLLPPAPKGQARVSVVVEHGGELYALLVDQVSEVMSLSNEQFETLMTTLPPSWARYCNGIYRLPGKLLVVLDVDRLLDFSTTSA